MDKTLRLVPSLGGFLWLTRDQLAMGWQVCVVVDEMDATLQVGPPVVAEGHHVAVDDIREAVEFRNLQGFWSQSYDATVGFCDFHVQREHLHVCLSFCEPEERKKYEDNGEAR